MQAFTHLLSRTRLKINKWRHHGVNDIDSELIKTKPDIKALEESDLDLNSQHTLMELYNKLAALQRQCNTKWAQRARMLWVKDGDRNTLFFHYITRTRSHFNVISQVIDNEGNIHREQSDICQAFCNFYATLWESPAEANFNILEAFPNCIPRFSDDDSLHLIREISKDEVYLTILGLSTGKSPGSDGFNVEVFRTFWPVIGDQLFLSIRYFFDNSSMPSFWGKTYIALILKTDNSKRISDYRPISLCNVCFKIITKLLANRLKMYLPKVVSKE